MPGHETVRTLIGLIPDRSAPVTLAGIWLSMTISHSIGDLQRNPVTSGVFSSHCCKSLKCFVLVKLLDLLAVANQSELMKLEACAYPIKSVQ